MSVTLSIQLNPCIAVFIRYLIDGNWHLKVVSITTMIRASQSKIIGRIHVINGEDRNPATVWLPDFISSNF